MGYSGIYRILFSFVLGKWHEQDEINVKFFLRLLYQFYKWGIIHLYMSEK